MAEQFQRKPFLFGAGGINLNSPPDLCPDEQYPYALNVYSAQQGSIQPRPGLSRVSGPTIAPVVQIKRVNNSLPGAPFPFQRYIADGLGRILGGEDGSLVLDSNYSGSAPSMVTATPPQAPDTWMYVADKAQMRKLRTDQHTAQNMGIFPPTQEPQAAQFAPDDFWINLWNVPGVVAAAGIAGTPAGASRAPASTTILAILYDNVVPGWASVAFTNPTSDYSFLGRKSHLTFGSETAIVDQVFQVISSTTVAGIAYDSGSTGLATIQMSTPFSSLVRDQFLHLGGTEWVRVLSVTQGADGLSSFRCVTVGTIAVGAAIVSAPAARVYFNETHTAGEAVDITVTTSAFTIPITPERTGALTITQTSDLSQIGNRPITQDDYVHISIRVDLPVNVLYGRIMLDVDATTNDFTRNFYYKPFEQNDFTTASQGLASQTTAQQQAIALQQTRSYDATVYYESGALGDSTATAGEETLNPYANYPITSSMQSSTGSLAWTEFIFKVQELQRVGSDTAQTLANVKAMRVELTVSGPVNLSVSSFWTGGTFGPDVLDSTYGIQGFPILARYRYRSSMTGAISVQSPPLRSGIIPRRQAFFFVAQASPDPQVDFIDWEVFGGTQESWHYIGSCPNTAGGRSLFYDLNDTAILANDPLSSVCFPPVPVSDSPKHSVVNVVGTSVIWVSGDTFNPKWAAGATLLINGKGYTLYAPPASSTRLQTVENIGVLNNVVLFIGEPTIMGQPVPQLWGPDQQGRYFFSGDPYNPGRVYVSNADADGGLDGVSDQTFIEVSSASDPVLNGAIIEDASIVLTANTLQRLQPSYGEQNINYTPTVLETGRGLYARNAMVVYGGKLYYLGNDGIYRWSPGTGSENITDKAFGPLFPHASLPGYPISRGTLTVFPPDFTRPEDLRLGSANGYIVFDYPDTQGTFMSMAYCVQNGAWWLWQYANAGAVVHYQEEGQNINTTLVGLRDGNLALMASGAGDMGTPMPCSVFTKAWDAGDARSLKIFGDAWVKANPQGPPITVLAATDDYSTIVALPTPILGGSRIAPFFIDLSQGQGNLKRNLALGFEWFTSSSDAATQTLYYWEVGPWQVAPQQLQNWISQPTTHGMTGFQHLREVWLSYVSTAPLTLVITADGNSFSYVFPQSNGMPTKQRVDTSPIKGKLFKYATVSNSPFSLFFEDIEVKVKEWGTEAAYSSVRPFSG